MAKPKPEIDLEQEYIVERIGDSAEVRALFLALLPHTYTYAFKAPGPSGPVIGIYCKSECHKSMPFWIVTMLILLRNV